MFMPETLTEHAYMKICFDSVRKICVIELQGSSIHNTSAWKQEYKPRQQIRPLKLAAHQTKKINNSHFD